MKLGLRAAVGAVATVVALAAAPSAFAQAGNGCVLDGQAKFTPGLNTTSKAFSYGFSGTLASCQSQPAAGETAGNVVAGEPITIGGIQYALPRATGTGGCSSSSTAGIAYVTWGSGATTLVDYKTEGVAAAVVLQGTVRPNLVVTATDGTGRQITLSTSKFANFSSVGPLAFDPPDPSACNTPGGVTAARIVGFLGLGKQ